MNAVDEFLAPLKVDVSEGEQGVWRIRRFEVEENDPRLLRYALAGRPVPPGTYTKLIRGRVVVMSDTPAEIVEHLLPIRRARARVLINGLGLGVIVKAVLAKPKVKHVDVVELSRDVIALVGPHYACDRLTIHHASAYDMTWPRGTRWNMAWHDIWDSISENNLPQMARLHRKYAHRVGWQGSWAHGGCLQQRRRWKKLEATMTAMRGMEPGSPEFIKGRLELLGALVLGG